MFKNRFVSYFECGVIGFFMMFVSFVGLIMVSLVILIVISGFGLGGDIFVFVVLLVFIMM